jgi:hypothetical protein
LVLAPGAPGASDLRALAVQRIITDGPVAVASLTGDAIAADNLLDDLEEMGAPTGYIVDLLSEDDSTVEARLGDASLVVIEAGQDLRQIRSALVGAAEKGLTTAAGGGAVIVAEGQTAMMFGRWALQESGALLEGLGWLDDALILATPVDISLAARPVLQAHEAGYAVGIGAQTALVLGPDGQVEVWGKREIGVTLGHRYGGL